MLIERGLRRYMKIAIIGSRGIPNRYGGFEKFTEDLSVALANKGFQVYVSCEHSSDNNKVEKYKGVNLFYFPIRPPKSNKLRNLYEILYDIYSLFWASRRVDIIYMLSYTASPFFFIPKMFGKKLFVNPDGLEWKRDKFNFFEKQLLLFNEKMMVVWADKIIADSNEIKKYYDRKYNVSSEFIPYWVDEIAEVKWDHEKLPDLLKGKIKQNNYWLVVARLEPENNIHVIVEGYSGSSSNRPLVIVGNFQSKVYQERVRQIIERRAKDKEIYFTGAIYNQEILNMLRQNCFAYIHGHSVGGTNPSLLEAMIMKNIIITHDNEFNREVCGSLAVYFKESNELERKLGLIEVDTVDYLVLKKNAYVRVNRYYNLHDVANKYEELFKKDFESDNI